MKRRTPRSTIFPYTTLFRSQELEGDAVFAIGADRLIDSRRVPTVLLEAFHGFRDLQHRIALDDTCSCRACRQTERLNLDRKSTRLNSSHDQISYAVFCLKNI